MSSPYKVIAISAGVERQVFGHGEALKVLEYAAEMNNESAAIVYVVECPDGKRLTAGQIRSALDRANGRINELQVFIQALGTNA